MKTYLVSVELVKNYLVAVEASSEEQAMELAEEVDLTDDYYVDSRVDYLSAEEDDCESGD